LGSDHSSDAATRPAGAGATARPSEGDRATLFREAMAALASGVAVVTARRTDGHPVGLLATSVAAYSAEPPSILLAIAHSSRSHLILIHESERFGVHLLARHQEESRGCSQAAPTTSTSP
jgi:flavin reductase (DIM6/NTAB) family NADH-FMN oxidoreductase RutF